MSKFTCDLFVFGIQSIVWKIKELFRINNSDRTSIFYLIVSFIPFIDILRSIYGVYSGNSQMR